MSNLKGGVSKNEKSGQITARSKIRKVTAGCEICTAEAQLLSFLQQLPVRKTLYAHASTLCYVYIIIA